MRPSPRSPARRADRLPLAERRHRYRADGGSRPAAARTLEFVSVGNKADISSNDLLEYWENDRATDVILLYLESFGNPRRFTRIARRVSQRKPILAVKSGRSAAGARATTSHTGALVSASDVSVDALFQQAGVIRADTIGALLDTASLLVPQPAPRGDRVAIVTNGGGPGILCADACQSAGLAVPELSADVRGEIAGFLAVMQHTQPDRHDRDGERRALPREIEMLVASGECDAIVALFVPPLSPSRPTSRARSTSPRRPPET